MVLETHLVNLNIEWVVMLELDGLVMVPSLKGEVSWHPSDKHFKRMERLKFHFSSIILHLFKRALLKPIYTHRQITQ